jgi:hypothetical protein
MSVLGLSFFQKIAQTHENPLSFAAQPQTQKETLKSKMPLAF